MFYNASHQFSKSMEYRNKPKLNLICSILSFSQVFAFIDWRADLWWANILFVIDILRPKLENTLCLWPQMHGLFFWYFFSLSVSLKNCRSIYIFKESNLFLWKEIKLESSDKNSLALQSTKQTSNQIVN